MFNIVLVEPQIPPNTGNIARLCVNLDATLHLVKPLGFSIESKALKRAGLDYWSQLDLVVWESFEEFLNSLPIDRAFFATTKSNNLYWDANYNLGDYLIFGSETKGLDETILKTYQDRTITIPMGKNGRSLNLATTVGIVTYEALRQNYSKADFKKITIEFKRD
jgi:tRNA (cytidine/uridine-2'-O-)-methyltransferase